MPQIIQNRETARHKRIYTVDSIHLGFPNLQNYPAVIKKDSIVVWGQGGDCITEAQGHSLTKWRCFIIDCGDG